MLTYNIPRDKLADAKVITPGGRSPTISPLDDPAWCSVTVLVPSKRLANVMDQLEVRSLLLLLLLLLWPWIDIWFSVLLPGAQCFEHTVFGYGVMLSRCLLFLTTNWPTFRRFNRHTLLKDIGALDLIVFKMENCRI